ncbi:MAG: MFS transporter [Spirochaetes bacterium]|nr:MFS transporter [Spirochaetota bacterium]
MKDNRIRIFLFLTVTFLFWTALYLYVPTLPTYIKTKTTNLTIVGLVLSMYGLWMVFIRLPMGLIGDSLGWGKPLIILGIFTASLGAFIMGRGNTLAMLAVGRAFTGLSAGTWVLLIAVFSTFFDLDQAVFASSLLTFSASLGRMIGTGLTGFLNQMGGYQLSFYLAAVTGILAIIVVFFIKEKRRPPEKVSLKSITRLLTRKDVLLPTIISIFVHYGDWSVTFGFLPILAQQMGAGDVTKSMLISANIASITTANLLNTFVLKKVKHTFLLSIAALLFFAGIVLIAFAPSITQLFGGTICMGFAFGIIYPILVGLSIQKVAGSQRSTAMGIHQSLYATGMFTGPWLSGIIADRIGIQPMFLITAGFCLLAVYLFLVLYIKDRLSGTRRR